MSSECLETSLPVNWVDYVFWMDHVVVCTFLPSCLLAALGSVDKITSALGPCRANQCGCPLIRFLIYGGQHADTVLVSVVNLKRSPLLGDEKRRCITTTCLECVFIDASQCKKDSWFVEVCKVFQNILKIEFVWCLRWYVLHITPCPVFLTGSLFFHESYKGL